MKQATDLEVADWLAKADADLRGAVLLNDASLFDLACFHCQQAAEKVLKALLVAADQTPPRLHDLSVVLTQVGNALSVQTDTVQADALFLSPLAVLPRYPGWGSMDAAAAQRALKAATRVIAFAQGLFEQA